MNIIDPKNQTTDVQTYLNEIDRLTKEIEQLRHVLNLAVMDKQRISEINKNLENIIAGMPGNIYWRDREGRYQYCNDQVAKMLKFSHRDQIKGKTVHEFMPPEFAIPAEANDNEVIEKGESISFEEIGFDREQNQTKVFLTKKAPLKDSTGKVIGVFGLAVDITERTQMEKELEIAKSQAEIASAAKSEFIANMSHDLRTPFSGILGFAYHLYQNEHNETKKMELGYVIESAEKLLSLLNDILQSTKDGMDEQFILSEFDFLQVVNETKSLFIAEIERKKLQFLIKSPYRSLKILSDKHRLHRILINLLSNAVKFTEQGSVTMCINLHRENDSDYLVFKCTDTGLGISHSAHDAIFERFTRLTSSYQGKYSGVGIGLWLVKKFIEDLSGEVKVDSQPGAGATFTCRLPIKLLSHQLVDKSLEQQSLTEVSPSSTVSAENALVSAYKILMVEDDEITLIIQLRLLNEIFADVDTARTGTEAIQKANQKQYDCILLDMGLPDMDGFEVADQIRQIPHLNVNTRIIGLTAHINQSDQARWQNAHVNELILKPLTHSTCKEISNWCLQAMDSVVI